MPPDSGPALLLVPALRHRRRLCHFTTPNFRVKSIPAPEDTTRRIRSEQPNAKSLTSPLVYDRRTRILHWSTAILVVALASRCNSRQPLRWPILSNGSQPDSAFLSRPHEARRLRAAARPGSEPAPTYGACTQWPAPR
jgi:hypothetical protein